MNLWKYWKIWKWGRVLIAFLVVLVLIKGFSLYWDKKIVPEYAEQFITEDTTEKFVPGILDDPVARKVVFKILGDGVNLVDEMVDYANENADEMTEIITDALK